MARKPVYRDDPDEAERTARAELGWDLPLPKALAHLERLRGNTCEVRVRKDDGSHGALFIWRGASLVEAIRIEHETGLPRFVTPTGESSIAQLASRMVLGDTAELEYRARSWPDLLELLRAFWALGSPEMLSGVRLIEHDARRAAPRGSGVISKEQADTITNLTALHAELVRLGWDKAAERLQGVIQDAVGAMTLHMTTQLRGIRSSIESAARDD